MVLRREHPIERGYIELGIQADFLFEREAVFSTKAASLPLPVFWHEEASYLAFVVPSPGRVDGVPELSTSVGRRGKE